MKILVTGGCGFVGSNLIRTLVQQKGESVVNLDKLTYAGNLESLADLADHPNYSFEQVDLCDAVVLRAIFSTHRPDAVMHLAAESHVDHSIDGPGEFIQTNVVGTFNLLQSALEYWRSLPGNTRFLHVSTDEVYGSCLDSDSPGFSETTPYDPHSPYSASKAASDHLARAWHNTYGLPVLVTNCSNNYGPYQFPEKLIPVVIFKCLRGEPIPVYGKGENIRDWIFVKTTPKPCMRFYPKAASVRRTNIGGNNELQNIELVRTLCQLMDELVPEYKDMLDKVLASGFCPLSSKKVMRIS